MNQKGLREDVKVVINSLLVPHAKGLTLDRLLKEYREYEMKPFPFRQLGYNSPQAFLSSIPDVVKCTTLASGHLLLQAVPNKNVSHIQELVQGQKNSQNYSFKVINKLLREQPMFNRYNIPPPVFCGNRNSKPGDFLAELRRPVSVNGHKIHGRHSQIFQDFEPPHIPPPTLPSRTCSSLEAEFLLIEELTKLLKFFPTGIETFSIYEHYSSTFRKPLLLQEIQEGLTFKTFFEKHPDVFRIWKDSDDNLMVALKESYLKKLELECETRLSVPPPPYQQNLTNPTPMQNNKTIGTSPQSVEAIHQSSMGPSVKPKWVAADIRTQGPGVSSLQTVTVGWNHSKQSPPALPNQIPRKIAPVPWRPPPRSDNDLPAAFGVTKPKVKNVYEPDTEITRQQFPNDISDFDYFFIIVAEVYSPGEFYWFLSDNRKAIESLTDDLTLFYNSNEDYVITRNEMYIGQLVAAMYTDNLWYRARVLGAKQEEFLVFFVDYGSQNVVGIDQIRHLPLHFIEMPIQAFRGRIFGIRPLPHEKKWSYEAGRLFLNLVKGSKVIAAAKMAEETITNRDNQIETVYALTLVDTTKDGDVHFNDYLIDNGFAVLNDGDARSLQLLSVQESVTESSIVESLISVPSPSPLPTCAFPSVASSVPLSQLGFTTPPPDSTVKGDVSPLNTQHLTVDIPSSNLSNEAAIVPPKIPLSLSPLSLEENSCVYEDGRRPFVKQLILKDGRKLYVVQDDGDLYLPRFDMLMLIPSLERQMDELKMKTDIKVIDAMNHPHIFSDCQKAGAPWIIDANGEQVSQIHLYLLIHVLPLLYVFGVKDKLVASAIEAEIKEFNNPSTA